MVSGSDDYTMFLWSPSTGKQHIARLTGHQQLINQVRGGWGGRKEGRNLGRSRGGRRDERGASSTLRG